MGKTSKLMFVMFALIGGSLAGCNTIRGAGQDVSTAGQGIENAAEDVQDDMQDGSN